MLWFGTNAGTTHRDLRVLVGACVGLVVTYSVAVMWYVATFPDAGVRCLLPESAMAHTGGGVEVAQFVDETVVPSPGKGDRLISINSRPVTTFLDVVEQLSSLRSAKIEPGGQLAPGSDPSEEPVPGLVEIFGRDGKSAPERLVEVKFRVLSSAKPELENRVYIPIRPIHIFDISMTMVWFVCQLLILGVALAGYWHRPFDRVSQNFCLMCCASMGAFVAGFHWWILASSPLLNIPFIICAAMLPAMVLNFFLVFPAEPEFVRRHRPWMQFLLFGPASICAMLLVIVYWSAWCLNGRPDSTGALNVYQRMAVIVRMVLLDGSGEVNFVGLSTSLLSLLRTLVHASIGVASVYFGATVVQLGTSFRRIQNPRERYQAMTILVAALVSTLPIGYTLYLAYFRKIDFALGHAQAPMFMASMLFMAAYAHGMFRHRLMLADDVSRSGRYTLMSLGVSGSFATFLAIGGVAAHAYQLPLNSSTAQEISLFLILLLAASLSLWVRDRLQSVVDRQFFSEKYQLDRTLTQLNRAAGILADPSGLADITLKTCQDVIDASFSAMYARDTHGVFRLMGSRSAASLPTVLKADQVPGDEGPVVQRVPTSNRESMTVIQKLMFELKAELLLFLQDDNGPGGIIVVGRRRGGTSYSAEDIAFLQAIGQMSMLALQSSRANQTLAKLDAELKVKVDRISEQQRQLAMLRAELTNLQRDAGQVPALAGDETFMRDGVRGNSPALLDVLDQIRKVARSSSTVLVRGESGTGKELLARVIHRNSERSAAPLVSVNCAALSSSLLESELFGHVKGAFTGAHADKVGRFQAAHGGTLFLDEIGDISAETQVKLLRVLQERCFEPVGSDRTVQVDVRLIAATNRDLESMIAAGEFREDLYYRLNVVSVTLPPLRQRKEDLIELIFFFLSRSSQKARKQIRQIDPEAIAALEQHDWPGNIRELENVMERAVVLADTDVIRVQDLPQTLRQNTQTQRPIVIQAVSRPVNASESRRGFSEAVSASESTELLSGGIDGLGAEEEERLLREVLRSCGGNKASAARRLNLPRSTFYSKCKKYGIQPG